MEPPTDQPVASNEIIESLQQQVEYFNPNGPTSHLPTSTESVALVPLRPATKRKELEVKKLPIVLGRTNLAQWWYQSCGCQHYYCRLHCRPVAQNIGSLSKVMIQIDSKGKVFVVGKNPHLVTITPERNNDSILQVNDVLSIGRRDREPWMRFQVVRCTNSTVAFPLAGNADDHRNRNNAAASSSLQQHSSSSLPSSSSSGAVSGEAAVLDNPMKKQLVEDTEKAKQSDRNIKSQKSSSNISSPRSENVKEVGLHNQHEQQRDSGAKLGVSQPLLVAKNATSQQKHPVGKRSKISKNYRKAENSVEDQHLPEWITTTNATQKKGNRSTSSMSTVPRGSNLKRQQQHQAIIARLTQAAVAASAAAAAPPPPPSTFSLAKNPPALQADNANRHHHPEHESSNNVRKRRRTTDGIASRDLDVSNPSNGASGIPSGGIRTTEDLLNGSRTFRSAQIHLVFQDYETSARLVQATQRNEFSNSCHRQPRSDRIFISKLEEEPKPHNPVDGSFFPRTIESEVQDAQYKLLSKNFAAALLGTSSSVPAASGVRSNLPSATEMIHCLETNISIPQTEKTSTTHAELRKTSMEAPEESSRSRSMLRNNDSFICTAVLAKYAAEKEAVTEKRDSSTQAEGEKTSEQGDENGS